jgi:CheY-like chemotaxis protein
MKSVQLHFQAQSLVDHVRGDADRIRIIFVNLVHFLVAVSNKGGTIWFYVEELHAEGCDISYHLNCVLKEFGNGFPDDYFSFLSGIVVEGNDQCMEEHRLVLLDTYQLIKQMGGNMRCITSLGLGTTFQLTIPLSKATQLPSEPPSLQSTNAQSQAYRVLVVDDNNINRRMQKKLLEQRGCICDTAENGLEAVEKCVTQKYDMVLMDIQMPVMDGYEAVKKIRLEEGVNRDSLIIALSANYTEDMAIETRRSGMDDFVCKPLQRDKIVVLLTKMQMRALQLGEKRASNTCR